jgi:hypothetical protein
VYASAEWFGDPWYGSKKTLQIEFAIKKKVTTTASTPARPQPTVNVQPKPVVATPAYPSTTTTATLPTYPSYPGTTTTTQPTYPSYPGTTTTTQPSYPGTTTTTTTLPSYPSYPTAPTAPTTTTTIMGGGLPSYPSNNTYPTYPTTNLPTYPSGVTYPVQPSAPTTTTVIHAPQPQVVVMGGGGGGVHQQQSSWQYEDSSTHSWINYTPQENQMLDSALSMGKTKVLLSNTYGQFKVTMSILGKQVNIKTNGTRTMRFLVKPNDPQGVGQWQFEDGKPGSNNWKNYTSGDATKLAAARSQGLHTCRLTNRWGTYAITWNFVGVQENVRTKASRRVRYNVNSSVQTTLHTPPVLNQPTSSTVISGTGVTLSAHGKWQFEDGNQGSGRWKDLLAQDQIALDQAVSQGLTQTMITNRFGTYQINFKNPPTQGVQKNVRTNGTRRIRYTGQISAAPAVHQSHMGAHLWGSAMAL